MASVATSTALVPYGVNNASAKTAPVSSPSPDLADASASSPAAVIHDAPAKAWKQHMPPENATSADGNDNIHLAASWRGVPGRTAQRPTNKDTCLSIEEGIPANLHWDDVDQFKVMDGKTCKPVLPLVDGSCASHMELGTRCGAFCATSIFYTHGKPIDLSGGSMCRAGEMCEYRQESSRKISISNKVVDRHVRDTTISVTPSASWGYGIDEINIPLPSVGGSAVKRSLGPSGARSKEARREKLLSRRNSNGNTHSNLIHNILLKMREQEAAEANGTLFYTHTKPIFYGEDFDAGDLLANGTYYVTGVNGTEHTLTVAGANGSFSAHNGGDVDAAWTPLINLKKWFKNVFSRKKGSKTAGAGASSNAAVRPGQEKASITIPYGTITNPTGSLTGTFTRHWLKEHIHTHYKASEEAEFWSLTHKQVKGDGCGSFALVPQEIATCGWQALPRVPRHMQKDVLDWLATASIDEIDASDFKFGVWSKDGSHRRHGRYQQQMWEIGAGGCPATYHEFPTCTHSYVKRPDGQAMGRVVFVKRDCDSGQPLPRSHQVRPYRESVDFDLLFEHHLLKDARHFNPEMGHEPPHVKGADPVYSSDYATSDYVDNSNNNNANANYDDGEFYEDN